ncbi:MAG: LLM class flavin-dependent oxidoreductase [Alphaproteobacteria bacterium]|nr:LLM class flavin-dependent oxidoreductase [Alphaproteobacteria bacterium]
MKFSLFVHMERSDPAERQEELFQNLTELVVMAEAGGFETAWVGEHHGMEFTIAPNPFINLAYLGAKTHSIRLGTGTVIAPFWHPIKLAGEAAMTDLATGGRLDLGLARGAYSFEYERLMPGLDAWAAGQRLREMVPALRGLWRGDYAHDGAFWKFPATSSAPKPLQSPYPPIWVAARDPNSHDFAVANGCHVQVTPLASGDGEVASLMERFNAAVGAHPEMKRPQIMLLMHTFVAQSADDVTRLEQDLSAFYCTFAAWFQNKRPVRQGFIEPLSEAERAAMPNYSPEAMAKNLVIGRPEQVIERLKSYEALGYDQYSIWIDSGIGHERKKRSLELFIRQVMPAFM